jgi:AraC-like DNA-binding protein
MNLIHDLQNQLPGGQTMPVPATLLRVISPWARPVFRKYDFGHTLVQEFTTRKCSIYSWRFYMEKPGRFYLVCDKPVITLQFMLSGTVVCDVQGHGEQKLEQSKCGLFYLPRGVNQAWFEPGKYESLHIELDPLYLQDISDAYPEITRMIKRSSMASMRCESMATVNINYVMKAILKNLRNCTDKGAALNMEMQKYIMELLSEYVHEAVEVKKDRALEYVPYKDTLIRIKQWIMESPDIHLQTQENLSIKYGISLTALKMNFSALFGFSLARFVRFHALTKAHYLIATTRQSIDDISEEVGYSNRTAFNQAFKKQFRYLPSHVRENPDESDQIQQE